MGNNPDSTGGYMNLPEEVKGMNQAQRDQYLKSLAKEHIKEKPLRFIQLCIIRLFDTHNRESIGVAWNQKGLVSRYGTGILLPLKIINLIYWLAALCLGVIAIIIFFILLAVGLNTGGQVFLKMGTGQAPLNIYLS